jgi:hypothetical protein
MIEFSDDGASAQIANDAWSLRSARHGRCTARGRQRTIRVGTRLDRVEQLHRADVVDVDLLLEDDDHPLAVELDGEDARRKQELADGRLALQDPEIREEAQLASGYGVPP